MNLHASARDSLSAWSPPDAAQAVLRAEYVAHLDANPDGVWRTCLPEHVTASAIVLDEQATSTMLVLHAKLGLWVQPGGHCEAGDASLAQTALREGREETGLGELRLHPAPVRLSRHGAPCGAQTHFDVQYAVFAAQHACPTVSAESHDVRWFDVTALPSALADGVRDSVRSAAAAISR